MKLLPQDDWKYEYKKLIYKYNTNQKRDGLDFLDFDFMIELESFIQSEITKAKEEEQKKLKEKIDEIKKKLIEDPYKCDGDCCDAYGASEEALNDSLK